MEAPYHICLVRGCTKIGEKHHSPPRSTLLKEHYDDPRFHRYLCREHHRIRHDKLSYEEFKKEYPEYDGCSPAEYRKICKEEIISGY